MDLRPAERRGGENQPDPGVGLRDRVRRASGATSLNARQSPGRAPPENLGITIKNVNAQGWLAGAARVIEASSPCRRSYRWHRPVGAGMQLDDAARAAITGRNYQANLCPSSFQRAPKLRRCLCAVVYGHGCSGPPIEINSSLHRDIANKAVL